MSENIPLLANIVTFVLIMKQVVLSVTNNLEEDQRVNKVALSLKNMGYDVLVVGTDNTECHAYNPGYKTKILHVIFKKGFLFYAEFNLRLFFYLLTNSFDVYVANDTDSLMANYMASTYRKKKLVVDLHELFPEVPEVVNRKFVKWFWTKIEDLFLPKVKYGYTVCQSIADYYKDRYGINLKVVRNLPQFKKYEGRKDLFKIYGDKKVILYQGCVNEGRGIEWIMEAMKYVENAVFVVIGEGDLYQELKAKAEEQFCDRVFFYGRKPYAELLGYTLSSDLGVCLLKNQGLSYYYALPNRVFDYMQAHIPILATAFPEISRVVNKEKTGLTLNSEDPKKIAEVIEFLLRQEVDHSNFERAANIYNWENEEKVLRSIYENL